MNSLFFISDFITPMATSESAAENEAFRREFMAYHDYQQVLQKLWLKQRKNKWKDANKQ